MDETVTVASFSKSEMSFFGHNSDSAPMQSFSASGVGAEKCDLDAFKELVTLLFHDEVSLTSVVHGLPEEYHDAVTEHLVDILYIASEVAPVETSRILSTLLQMEFDRATQKRNDVHTFMRGNGVVPKVFEGLLAKVTSADGGLEERLVTCCTGLCEESVLSNVVKPSEEHLTTFVDNVATSSNGFLLEALDYFGGEATSLWEGIDNTSCSKDAYAATIASMSLRILDVVQVSLSEWPWSLRESLRSFLETIEVHLENSTNSLLEVKENDSSKLTSLGQNVMATVVVLRAVIPALFGALPRLFPGESCFDKPYVLLQKRFTMLAKVIQKAAHGLLFNGPHEKGMAAFNNELPALTQHCSNAFVSISRITDPPTPSQDKSILGGASKVTLRFRKFLDNHVVYFVHAAMKCNPIMGPAHWTRIMRLAAYGGTRLGGIDHHVPPALSHEKVRSPNVGGPSSAFGRPRRLLRFSWLLGNIRLTHGTHTMGAASEGSISGSGSGSNNANRNVIDSQDEGIFNELISYALGVTANPSLTELHVCFCSIIGMASDNTVAIVVYWDLLRTYIKNYHSNEKTELRSQCPQFYQFSGHSGHRDGDSLAFLFLLVDMAMTTANCKGFRLILIAGKSNSCFSWTRNALKLLPTTHVAACVQVLFFGTCDFHVPRGGLGVGSVDVMVIRGASDLFAVLEELHLYLPLGAKDYRMLLEEKDAQEEKHEGKKAHEKTRKNDKCIQNTEKLFPSASGEIFCRSLKSEFPACGTLPLLLHENIEGQYVRLWSVALMRDVFKYICTTILSFTVFTADVRNDVQPSCKEGVAASLTGKLRLRAVELFLKFDGDILLHLKSVPKLLRETVSHSRDSRCSSGRRPLQLRSRFRFPWFSASHENDADDVEANECILSHALFSASRRFYAMREFAVYDGSYTRERCWPNIVPSLRHSTPESLWRLLLYNLWGTFAWMRHVLPLQCPIMCMVAAVRAYLGDTFQISSSSQGNNFPGESDVLLHVAADALASLPIAGVHLVRFLVDICEFVRLIDFAGPNSETTGKDGSPLQGEAAMIESVIRIIFRNEKIGDAEVIVARLIGSKGVPLLNAVECLPLRNTRR